jgi:hypothetical protein
MLISLALLSSLASSIELYGLTRVVNSDPAHPCAKSGCSQLVSVDGVTGALTKIGHGHQALAALGDLVTIDAASRTYYFLGGGWNSTATFLVGISLDTGAEVCSAELPAVGEIGIVGGGQSLSLDASRDRLVITGVRPDDPQNASSFVHSVLTAPANGKGGGGCGPFSELGTFAFADAMPVAHAAELDDTGNTLFVDLATGQNEYAIGVVDVTSPSASSTPAGNLLKKLIIMNTGVQQMWGLSWRAATAELVSVQHNAQEGSRREGTLDWRTLDPATEEWHSRPLLDPTFNSTANYTAVWGNLASVRAYDHAADVLYVLVAVDRQEKLHIGAVDAKTGALLSTSPQISEGGKLLWASNGLLQLKATPARTRTAA